MNRIILFFLLLLPFVATFAQQQNMNNATCVFFVYRTNEMAGKWVKAKVWVDFVPLLKIGNRSRAILNVNTRVGDTIKFAASYQSLGIVRYKELSIPVVVPKDSVYIRVYFETEIFNPFKHFREPPGWSCEAEIIDQVTGVKVFDDEKYFKDNGRKKVKVMNIRKEE